MYAPYLWGQSCGIIPMNLSHPSFFYKRIKYNIKIEHGTHGVPPPQK